MPIHCSQLHMLNAFASKLIDRATHSWPYIFNSARTSAAHTFKGTKKKCGHKKHTLELSYNDTSDIHP